MTPISQVEKGLTKESQMNMPYTDPSGDKVFTIPEVAAYLNFSKSKIYSLVTLADMRPGGQSVIVVVVFPGFEVEPLSVANSLPISSEGCFEFFNGSV